MAGAAGVAPAILGSSTVNVAPCPGVLATEMVPPWASTVAWQIASPRPVPQVSRPRAASARVKRSNSVGKIAGSMPSPESATSSATIPSPASTETSMA